MAGERVRRRDRLHPPGGGPVQHLYRQIANELAAQIRQGDLPVGGLVPSERQVCERYGVSAITARRALQELTRQHLIYRQVGLGSFVADPARRKRLALVSAGFDMRLWQSAAGAMGEIVGGASEVAWRHDCLLNLVRIDQALDTAMLSRLIGEGNCDGLLLRTADDVRHEQVELLEEAGFPYVFIRRHLTRRPMSCVVPNDQAGGRLAVAHLVARGHRRIGFIAPTPRTVLHRERLRIYQAALATHKLSREDGLIELVDTYGAEAGYRRAMRLLSLDARPSAVIVGVAMASGVYQAAADLRLRIPEDIAVVGYGDVPEVRSLVPALTRVGFSHYETGKVAAEALLDLILGRTHGPQRLVIEPTLVAGASCTVAVQRHETIPLSR